MEDKICGFLTYDEIEKVGPRLFRRDFNREKVEAVSYRLHLGSEVYVSGADYPKYLSEKDPYVSLPRGQFALLLTKEYITMDKDLLGLISIRMGKKEQGLINISGFHVDPGFTGNLIFSVFNAGPSDVVLKYDDDMFVIFLYQLHHDAKTEKTFETHGGQKHLPVHIVTSLKGTSASLADVDKRVRDLEVTSRIFIGLLAAVAVGLIALFVQLIAG